MKYIKQYEQMINKLISEGDLKIGDIYKVERKIVCYLGWIETAKSFPILVLELVSEDSIKISLNSFSNRVNFTPYNSSYDIEIGRLTKKKMNIKEYLINNNLTTDVIKYLQKISQSHVIINSFLEKLLKDKEILLHLNISKFNI